MIYSTNYDSGVQVKNVLRLRRAKTEKNLTGIRRQLTSDANMVVCLGWMDEGKNTTKVVKKLE